MVSSRLNELFGSLPIFGMVHLAGPSSGKDNWINRALDEIAVYEEAGLSGAIVENYHRQNVDSILEVLKALRGTSYKIAIGVNVLPNDFKQALELADEYNCNFIQLDYVAGTYVDRLGRPFSLNTQAYDKARQEHPSILVLGGVWPKYYTPAADSNLEDDLSQAAKRTDAVVVTGKGTGEETPIQKIRDFKKTLGEHPLIVGAGMDDMNARNQLFTADGAIVGSYFKKSSDTRNTLDEDRIKRFMDIVNHVREEKASVDYGI